LAYDVFSDSALFPVVLTIIGFGVVWLGIYWQRNEVKINGYVRRALRR
jgi:hypothetical protein